MIPVAKMMRVFHGEVHYRAEGYRDLDAALGITQRHHWETFSAGEQVAASPKTNCYQCLLDSGETVFVKRYVYTAKKKPRYWLLPSKPMIEAYGFAQLKKIGIPTLDVLAYGERRYLGSLRYAYIVTRGVSDSVSLEAFAEQWRDLPKEQQRTAFNQLRALLLTQLKQAHQAHFFHHDLKWRNILVQHSNNGYRLTWIDCPRAHYAWLLQRRAVMVDFAGLGRSGILYLSIYDMFRFVRDYLGHDAKPHQAKKLVRTTWKNLSKRLPRNYQTSIGEKNENTLT